MALTRFPLKTTTTAIYNPSESTTFSSMTPEASVVYTVSVTRNFRPYQDTKIYFPLGMPAGVLVSTIAITGTALGGYTATYVLYNGTSNTITPASQPVILYQVA